MSQPASSMTREVIVQALQRLSDAMKCMAARLGGTTGEQSDVADIRFLLRHLQLASAASVLAVVGRYYPPEKIPVKTQYLVEGLFEEGAP